jgi:hypothetical protein
LTAGWHEVRRKRLPELSPGSVKKNALYPPIPSQSQPKITGRYQIADLLRKIRLIAAPIRWLLHVMLFDEMQQLLGGTRLFGHHLTN